MPVPEGTWMYLLQESTVPDDSRARRVSVIPAVMISERTG
jgi:hypothetical protein